MLLDEKKMSEAEVSLRLALFLVRNKLIVDEVSVAIDGAQIQTGNTIHFPIKSFLQDSECRKKDNDNRWQGTYEIGNYNIIIHSSPGKGDLVAKLLTGHILRVESKKGTLENSTSSKEYPLLREAIGQLITIKDYNDSDRLAVAVPYSPKSKELTSRWRNAPLIKKLQLNFLLIHRNGNVDGLNYITK